jgi:hypothetical protein
MSEVLFQHPWLGNLWSHGQNELLGHIDVPPAIRPARNDGQTDAEVLIEIGARQDLPALVDDAAERVQAALADLAAIKTYAIEHAPGDWRQHYQTTDPTPLLDRLFLEGFTISAAYTEIAFDFGDLDLLVVRTDPSGHRQTVYLAP